MHQGGEYPSAAYYYPQQAAGSTSSASAPPYTDYSSYNNYPPPVSDPPPAATQHRPDTQLHYNAPPTSSYYPPSSSPSYPPHYDPPNYPTTPPLPPSSLNYNNNTQSYVSPKYDHAGSTYGVYAYQGKHEPYGASSKSETWSGLFDDYGRPISFPSNQDKDRKVVRAVPKADDQTHLHGGLQKFKVKLLPESASQSTMEVLCMVGLDGIRMLHPNTARTLRIYPLHTITRSHKIDSSTFAFWSKTSVDIHPTRIRLHSNTYTTNAILDTVTAATVQFKEMGGRIRPTEASRSLEVPSEKKKGLGDWITKLKPVNEEKDHWVPDEAVSKCTGCGSDFGAFNRRHHCRNCGDVFCDKCTQGRTPLTSEENAQPVRVCDRCMAEVTHRLSKAKEAASRPVTFQSHEDLAKKLQEEMERNLRISSGSKSESSSKRMREVACPTCTVHLQVQVPSAGSETIECGVCQQPFIVSAH